MHNNPAFQMFMMATVNRYWAKAPPELPRWRTGVNEMLLVSVGTGTSAGENYSLRPSQMHLLFNATAVPAALMYAALNEQDFLCRVFGHCVEGPPQDREAGTLIGSHGPLAEKLFRYARYNADLSSAGLEALGCGDIDPAKVQKLDAVDAMDDLERVGQAVAAQRVRAEHFNFGVFETVLR